MTTLIEINGRNYHVHVLDNCSGCVAFVRLGRGGIDGDPAPPGFTSVAKSSLIRKIRLRYPDARLVHDDRGNTFHQG